MLFRKTGVFLVVVAFLFVLPKSYAQFDSPFDLRSKWKAWGVRVQGQSFTFAESKLDTCDCAGKRDLFQRGNAGLVASFLKNDGKRLNYQADFGFSYGRVGTISAPTVKARTRLFTTIRLGANYHIGRIDQPIIPYFHSELHMQIGSNYSSLLTGMGLRYAFNRLPLLVTTEVNYGFGLTSKLRNSIIGSLGFYINLWGKTEVRQSAPTSSSSTSMTEDSDFDGVPDVNDKCPQMRGDLANGGCPVASAAPVPVTDSASQYIVMALPKNFIEALQNQRRDTVYKIIQPETKAPVSERFIVYFNFNKYDLALAVDTLSMVAAKLLADTSLTCTLIGHTDLDGSVDYNVILSRNRAEAVRNHLVEKGVSPVRITILYAGKDRPAISTTDRAGNILNRRVEIILSK